MARPAQKVIEAIVARALGPALSEISADLAGLVEKVETNVRLLSNRVAEIETRQSVSNGEHEDEFAVTRFGVSWSQVHEKVVAITVETTKGKKATFRRDA